MTGAEWLAFVGIWFLAGIPLGPNAANCILMAARHGAVRAHWTIVGILLASLVFQALVFLGVASLLATMAGLFTLLKLVGCAYLFWLAIKLWRAEPVLPGDAGLSEGTKGTTMIRDAFFVSLSNPKAILAYAAVFTQFINPAAPLAGQVLILTPTAIVVTSVIYSGYCLIGTPIRLFLNSARRVRAVNRGIAGLFATSAVAIAANEARR